MSNVIEFRKFTLKQLVESETFNYYLTIKTIKQYDSEKVNSFISFVIDSYIDGMGAESESPEEFVELCLKVFEDQLTDEQQARESKFKFTKEELTKNEIMELLKAYGSEIGKKLYQFILAAFDDGIGTECETPTELIQMSVEAFNEALNDANKSGK